MKPFNEILRKCIEQSEYTIYSISAISKVNRTTLQRALNGERTLSYENLQKLLPYLPLSPQQSQELKSAFIYIQLGETRYHKDVLILELLNRSEHSLHSLSYFSDFETVSLSEELYHTQLVEGSYNIINLICKMIIQSIKCDKEPFLYSLSHFQNDFFKDLYLQLEAPCFHTLDLKHIVPFIQAENSSTFNLQFLSTLLPFVFECDTNCQFYYYYEENDFVHACGSLFPYYIVTNHNVILLSCNHQKALILPEISVSQYKQHISGILSHANPLLETVMQPLMTPYSGIKLYINEHFVSFLYKTHENREKTCTLKELGLINSIFDFKQDLPLLEFAFHKKDLYHKYFINPP